MNDKPFLYRKRPVLQVPAPESKEPTSNPRNQTIRKRSPGENYDVGYGKPPKKHQFKKGAPSANPRGRPKGAKNHRTIVIDALNTKITVREGGKTRQMTKFEVGVVKLVNRFAETGDLRAFKHISELLPEVVEPISGGPNATDDPRDPARLTAMLKFAEDFIRTGGSFISPQDAQASSPGPDDDGIDGQGE